MYRAGRTVWGLVAVGAATAVGVTTKNPGFIVITFLGTLALPRILGLTPRGWNRHGFGPHPASGAVGLTPLVRERRGGECSLPRPTPTMNSQ
jgi:hypothetical protein